MKIVKESITLFESKKYTDGKDIINAVKNSRKLSKELKEKIIPLLDCTETFGSRYTNGVVTRLVIPSEFKSKLKGVDLGVDKDGFFVMTHRARSKSKPEINKIPDKDIKFIESTG